MEKKTFVLDNFTKAGPYSHVVEANGFLFLSGIIPVDRASGQRLNEISAATRLVLENIKATLDAVGSSLDRVVKTTVFLRDMTDFAAMNEVYAEYFAKEQPARSCVAVKTIPLDLPVEIEIVALR